jgi:hypothetical protein
LNFKDKKDLHNNYRLVQYKSSYGYELEKVLERYPIIELREEGSRAALIRSLQRGNLQFATFDKPHKMERLFIEANPEFRTINIHSMASRAAKKNGPKGSSLADRQPGQPTIGPIREEVPAIAEEEPVESGEPVSEDTMVSKPLTRKGNRK